MASVQLDHELLRPRCSSEKERWRKVNRECWLSEGIYLWSDWVGQDEECGEGLCMMDTYRSRKGEIGRIRNESRRRLDVSD